MNTNGFSSPWPEDVGILNMEIYFPSQYVDQSELESFDNVSQGKYTVGLGQTRMGFCSDSEDVNSLCLTAVDNLIRKTPGIGFENIGRLEVGTETIVDKSKSVKSVLMKLFEESGNSDVEGIDSTNACYGGTAALFNCVSWIESSYWDGRLAIAVCADIAVYASGNARPTGGAGAVAMLIGPNAGLVLDRKLRATHVQHAYDFYKPDMSSEYPTVDGKLSIQYYLHSLDKCYNLYKAKARKKGGPQTGVTLEDFDAILFHTPFCKLVQKSLARLAFNDFLSNPSAFSKELQSTFANIDLESSYFNKDLEKAFMSVSNPDFLSKTKPSLEVATNVGNMYTSSLYGGLVSFLISKEKSEELIGSRVALFSYGSGLASSFYSLRVNDRIKDNLLPSLADVRGKLDSRSKISPSEFTDIMSLREKTHHSAPYQPSSRPEDLFPGTWYLTDIDKLHRRSYARKKDAKGMNGH